MLQAVILAIDKAAKKSDKISWAAGLEYIPANEAAEVKKTRRPFNATDPPRRLDDMGKMFSALKELSTGTIGTFD